MFALQGDESDQSWFKSMMDGFIEGEAQIPVESFGPHSHRRDCQLIAPPTHPCACQ